jgi:hypothetical protein
MIYEMTVGRAKVTVEDRKGLKVLRIEDTKRELPTLTFRTVEDRNIIWFDGKRVLYAYLVPDLAVALHEEGEDGIRMIPIALNTMANEKVWKALAECSSQEEVVKFVHENAKSFSSTEEVAEELIKALKGEKV